MATVVRSQDRAHGRAAARHGRRGSRSSRRAGFAERVAQNSTSDSREARLNDERSCKGRSGSGRSQRQGRRRFSRGSVMTGSRQQDGQSMYVSSTCGADRMESLKDRKAGPGGVTRCAARSRRGDRLPMDLARRQGKPGASTRRSDGEHGNVRQRCSNG